MNGKTLRAVGRGGVFALAAGFCLLCGAVAWAEDTVRVSTAEELVRSLGPARTLLLEPGLYDLGEACHVQSAHVSWEEVYDGRQLVVHDVVGLTLRAELGATILAEPRYSYTLSLLHCREILLEGLTIGHTEAGYCVGGVVRLEGCEEVSLEGCALYGSGTVGIEIADSLGVTVRASAISDCTAGAVWARGSAHLVFEDVEMLGTDSWPLIEVIGCTEVSFRKCRIAENFGSSLLLVDSESRYVGFPGTLIERNGTDALVGSWSGPVDLEGAVVLDNAFHAEDEDYADEWVEEHEDQGSMGYDFEGVDEEGSRP